ncbi:MAG: hypothetical protein KDA42_14765 [Planctomycetales bacterium]|nr:hypothetical protein [Planctomycetales bacterium]
MNPQARTITLILFAAMLAWGGYLAIGAYLYNHDPRRGLIVLVSFALFLGFWGIMLAIRSRKQRREKE